MKNTTMFRSGVSFSHAMRQWYLGLLVLFAVTSATTTFAQTGTINIGSGTATGASLVPINSCYGYNYTQQIVTAAEYAAGGGVPGQITKIRFYYASGGTSFNLWNNWTVYLGQTAKTSFTSNTDWEPAANLTQVFSGVITPVGNSWFEMTFTAPFTYNGTSNLIVAVDENVASWSCTATFGSYTGATNTAIYYRNDSTNPDPTAPPTATGRTNTLARLQFEGNVASCLAPTALVGSTASFTSGTVAFTASQSAPANGYQYYVSSTNTAPTSGTAATGTVAAGQTSLTATDLTPSTTYYVWVRSVCSGTETSSWAGPATFFTGYCTPAPISQDGTGITNVVLGTINNPSGSESATAYYGNYSAQSTNAALGSTVNFAITYSTGFTYDTKIWVDWNNDTDFNDAGEEVYTGVSLATNPTTLSGSFMVPANAALIGTHRVRIGGVDTGPPTPCYTGSWGSFEDYTITVFMPPAPVVTGFTPASYCAAAGDITITGTDLGNATLTIGGTAVPVTAANNTNTQIVANVPAGVSGVVSVTTVAGTSTTATSFAVTQPTPLVLSDGAETICAGNTTPSVTITSGASAFDTFVWSPAAGVTGSAATGWTFNPTATTTYMLTASQSNGPCVVNVEYVVMVNPLPNPVTVTTPATAVCLNSVVALTGNGGESFVPAAYCTPTVGSVGVTGDFINNFSFANVTNNNSGDAASDFTYYSALTANVTGGTSYTVTVQSGASFGQGFRVWIDYNKDGVFAADESVFSSVSGTTLQTGTVVIPASAINGLTRIRVAARWNGTPAATEACSHTGFGEYEDYNVNITGATNPVNYVWTPAAGLYTDAAATTPYVAGTAAQVVYTMVTSTTTTTYTATASTPLGCPTSGSVTLNTIVTPAPTGDSTLTLCAGTTVADLEAEGTAIQWYASATGVQSLAAGTTLANGTYYASQTANGCESQTRFAVAVQLTVIPAPTASNDVQIFCNSATVADLVATGTAVQWYTSATGGTALAADTAIPEGVTVYYASQTVGGCESLSRVAVAAFVNVYEAPMADATQTFCATQPVTVGDLTVYGGDITWYTEATGGTALADDTVLVSGTTYYASQTINGCESNQRVAVTAQFTTTAAPTATAVQTFCVDSGATVQSLIADGSAIQWYADATGGTALDETGLLVDGMVYYASQTINGCESGERFAVTAELSVTAAPAANDAQYFCASGTVADLMAEGNEIQWYADATGGTALDLSTELVNGESYYASQTLGGCEGERSVVTSYITVTPLPAGDAAQVVEVEQGTTATIDDLVVTGDNVMWYATEADAMAQMNPIAPGTVVESGTYYATQTVGNCTSAPYAVTLTVQLGRGGFDSAAFSYYPNPVKDVLNLSYSSDISTVTVFNLLGQQVLAKSINAATGTLDMSVLADGAYIVNVASGDTVQTVKVIKKQ